MGFMGTLGPEQGHIVLKWKEPTSDGEDKIYEDWIELRSTPQPFGGHRWWLVCPHRGDLVCKLYMPGGTSRFASRKAYRLAYHSQRESRHGRALSQAFRLRRRLG